MRGLPRVRVHAARPAGPAEDGLQPGRAGEPPCPAEHSALLRHSPPAHGSRPPSPAPQPGLPLPVAECVLGTGWAWAGWAGREGACAGRWVPETGQPQVRSEQGAPAECVTGTPLLGRPGRCQRAQTETCVPRGLSPPPTLRGRADGLTGWRSWRSRKSELRPSRRGSVAEGRAMSHEVTTCPGYRLHPQGGAQQAAISDPLTIDDSLSSEGCGGAEPPPGPAGGVGRGGGRNSGGSGSLQ